VGAAVSAGGAGSGHQSHVAGASVHSTFISLGNRKISCTVAVLDQPAMYTCPAAMGCKGYCSALKPQVGKWSGVSKARWRNFWASLTYSFVDKVVAEIRASGVRWVRFHTAGDLYNQRYVQKAAEIARRLPNVHFYLYTKSLHLNLTPLTSLPNFVVIKSFGGHFDHLINVNTDNYARVITNPNQQRKDEFLCPEGIAPRSGKARTKLCGYLCNYCLSNKKTEKTEPHQITVVFLLRKAGWNGNQLPPPPKPPAQAKGGVVK
jgi:hypothetical protein